MSNTQRAVLLGLAAVIALLAIVILPGDDDENETTATQAAQTTATQPAAETTTGTSTTETATTPAPDPEPAPPLLTTGKVTELEFEKGDTVRFRVRSSKPEEVHVHGYDLSKPVTPGKTTSFSFKANIEGIFEIELENSGVEIASLKVEPK
jgi:FtsP/CotA-like multicopper oxidase with cupredoxin domain